MSQPGDAAACDDSAARMIAPPSGVRVWLATGATDMRRGMNGLALQVQEALHRDPHAGDLYVFRGKRGNLLKILWHDGLGMSLYAKRLERGRFIWPSPADGVVRHHRRTARLYAGGDRLATSAADMATGDGRLTAIIFSERSANSSCMTTGACDFHHRCDACTGHSISDDIDTCAPRSLPNSMARREAEARASGAEAMVAHLKLMIAKLRHDQYGASSERGRKLLDQMELELEELEAEAAEDADSQ